MIVVKGGEKHLLLHRCASFVAKIRTKLPLVLIFPAGKACPGETPQENKGTKAKNATSCGNAFVTNILLA